MPQIYDVWLETLMITRGIAALLETSEPREVSEAIQTEGTTLGRKTMSSHSRGEIIINVPLR